MSNFLDIIKTKTPEVKNDPNKLNTSELQLLLQLLKQATLKGEQIELFYGLVIKLQNQYLEQNKQ